jgi:catechol 2,3-dioxygenase-like lactoylglutathione lyase family enzyme
MIGYVTVGTNDLPRAAAFYDALFGEIGGRRFMEMDRFIAWSSGADKAGFSIAMPYDGKAATVGNGVMIALQAGSQEQVDALYKKAMSLGATDEGAPGLRGGTFYAAYFRDLDGNKLNFFHM